MKERLEITREPNRTISRACEISNGSQRKGAKWELLLNIKLFLDSCVPTKLDHPSSFDCPKVGILWINHEPTEFIDLSFLNQVHKLLNTVSRDLSIHVIPL